MANAEALAKAEPNTAVQPVANSPVANPPQDKPAGFSEMIMVITPQYD